MVAQRSQPCGTDRPQHEIGEGEKQVGQRKCAPEAEAVGKRAANHGEEPDPTAEHSGQAAGAFDVKMQTLVQVASQNGKHGIIGKPLEKLADVGNPERTFEPGADFFEALREGQSGS